MKSLAQRGHSAFSTWWKKQSVPGQSAAPRKNQSVPNESGIALVAVLVFLLVIAAAVALKGGEELGEIHIAAADAEARRIDYAAQAGMQHALWRARNNACTGDFTIAATAIGPDQYSAATAGGGSNTVYTLPADQDAWIRSDAPTDNNGSDSTLQVRFDGTDFDRPLYRFDLSALPVGSRIHSAVAHFYVDTEHPEGSLTVHRVISDWTEGDATWDTVGDEHEAQTLASIPAQPDKDVWVSVNLTAQVQAWINGQPNQGIVLSTAADGVDGRYVSREGSAAEQPYLEVVVGSGAASPLNIQATGTLANGQTRDLVRPTAPAHQPPGAVSLQLGVDVGEDTILDSFYDARNFGGADYMQVHDNGSDWQQYPLLRFELAGVPRGAYVRSAQLELRLLSLDGPGAATVHQVTRSWVEGTKSGGGIADGATWFTHDGTNAWTSAGGDIDAAVVAETAINGSETWVSWDIAPLVQRWLAGEPNYGLLIKPDSALDQAKFASQEDSNVGVAPKLTITYACECGSACMAPQGSGNLLMVVDDKLAMGTGDLIIQALLEGWGYAVTLISDDAGQGGFDAEISSADVIFISESVSQGNLGTKVSAAPIGVVTVQDKLNDELGIATNDGDPVGDTLDVVDNDHYITRIFPTGALRFKTAATELGAIGGTLAPDARVLANAGGAGALVTLDAGGQSAGGGPVPARRALVPTGRDKASWNYLTNNGQLLVQRAIAWAMGADVVSIGNVLLVVVDPGSLTAQEDAKKALMESWDFTVNLIDESDSQADFDAAIAGNDVAYIPQDINSGTLGTKLRNASIGVVNEEGEQVDELGFANDKLFKSRQEIDVIDNSHYITETFATGLLTFASSNQSVHLLDGGAAPDLQVLGETFNTGSLWQKSLSTLDPGDTLSDGGSAAGRRVHLPWGGGTFDINALTDDGRTIMRRALEWGAGSSSGPSAAALLFVSGGSAGDPVVPTAQEQLRIDKIESWGYSVTLIHESALQADIDLALAANDVAYVSGDVNDATLGTKLTSTGLGIVNEQIALHDEMGFSSGAGSNAFDKISVVDNTHFITNGYATGWLTIATSSQDLNAFTGTLAGGLQTLATVWISGANYKDGLAVLDTGAALYGGGNAAGRRAQLPWGVTGFDFTALNADGLTIMERAIDWAAGGVGGGGANGLFAHWKLDDGVGMTALDSEGSNHGTLANGPIWVAGQIGDALDFDGTNDLVDVGTFDVAGSGLTLMGWFNADSLPGTTDPRLVSKASSTAEADAWWQLSILTSGGNANIRLRTKAGGTTSTLIDSSTNLNTGEWYFAVGTYDAGTGEMKLYLNGAEVASQSHPVGGVVDTNATVPVAIGANGSAEEFFDGSLDDVRVYDRALSASEIAGLYSAGGGGPTVVVFEELTEAKATAAQDLSIATPAGTVAGDLLIATLVTDGSTSASMSPPAGWTVIDLAEQGGNVTFGVWWKLAGASEPASYSFSWSGGEKVYGTVMRFTGHDPGSPIDVSAVAGGSSSTPASPAVTTTVPDTMILRLGGFDDDDITVDAPGLAGHTAITMDKSSQGNGTSSSGAGYVMQAAVGDSGTSTFTLTNTEEYRTVTLAIAPAP